MLAMELTFTKLLMLFLYIGVISIVYRMSHEQLTGNMLRINGQHASMVHASVKLILSCAIHNELNSLLELL